MLSTKGNVCTGDVCWPVGQLRQQLFNLEQVFFEK